MSRGLVAAVVALCLAGLLALPLVQVAAQEAGPVQVREQILLISRGGPDSDVGVLENLYLENLGDLAYDGEVSVDLHPEASLSRHYWHNQSGARYPGQPGMPSTDPIRNESAGGHLRFTFDLEERGVQIPPEESVVLVIEYTIPAAADAFTRGFTMDTETFRVNLADVPGLRPEADDPGLEPVRNPSTGAWTYRLPAGEEGPFEAGEVFAFTWVAKEQPLDPMQVDIEVEQEEPLRLRADVSGGIEPYNITWDTDGDGDCDDAEGETAEVPTDEGGIRVVSVCVADAAVPPGQATQSFQARVVRVEGTWDGPSPWLLLVIGILGGGFLVFALTQGGFIGAGRSAGPVGRPAHGAESREMLEMRQRVMVAALKELEIAKKKGEVPEAQYTSLKSELKKDTVAVMRELERRKSEKETV